MSEIERVLDPLDAFCPKCGHNRDTSSVSSIDEGNGRKSCQMCGAKWNEEVSEQVRAAVMAERERCAAVCWERSKHGPEAMTSEAMLCAAAIRRGPV